MNNFYKRILLETFLSEIKNSSVRKEAKKMIHDGYSNRVRLKMNQEDYAIRIGVGLSTVKRIELGNCYDLKLISKYID